MNSNLLLKKCVYFIIILSFCCTNLLDCEFNLTVRWLHISAILLHFFILKIVKNVVWHMPRNGHRFTLNILISIEHIQHSLSFSFNRWYWQKTINGGTKLLNLEDYLNSLTLIFYLNFSYFGRNSTNTYLN